MAFLDITPTATRILPNPIRALRERMKARKAAKASVSKEQPLVDWRVVLESMSATPTNPYCMEYAQYMLDEMRKGHRGHR